MPYVIEGDNVYYQDERIKQQVGTVNKTETIRIDDNTVADVVYQFDLQAGDYVEQSRVTRNEPMPPVPPTMGDHINTIDQRTVGMQAIDDFTLQQTFTMDDRTVGMQQIDDYTLQLVNDQAATIAQLQADVAALKGGA